MSLFSHDNLVLAAKAGGLVYLLAFSVAVLVYVLRPSKRAEYERAGRSVLDAEDRPWR